MAASERTTATVVLDVDDVVYFRVPADWVCGREADGLIVIYDDRPDSGTLRVWSKCYTFDDRAARDEGRDALHDGRPQEALVGGATLSYGRVDGAEHGEPLRFHQWRVAVPVGDTCLRTVSFVHTVQVANEVGEQIAWELSAIDAAVRNAHYRQVVPA